MNWLVGIVLASALAAFAVVNLVKYALAGVTHGIADAVRAVLFVGVGTAVTVGLGRRAFLQWVRRLRQTVQRRRP